MTTTLNGAATPAGRARVEAGWRAGKPVEDPEKLKAWGRIAARPSEYLIHMRRGKVVTASSGQGAACFKLPGDAVAVVPTTVQNLRFCAEQVTKEKVGVEVTGVAVYRIAEPLIAFRMVNFSYPERAQEKLEELLGEMFVGAVRRLVACLTVEECLSRRKEGIAAELMKEIVPVVSGSGRPEDGTDQGWGIVMDSVEIQDVRVLSEAVFANMQARFRQEQEREAREAALVTDRAVKLGEAEAQRTVELSRLAAGTEVAKRKREAEEDARLGEIASAARLSDAKIAQERTAQQATTSAAQEAALGKLNADIAVSERRRVAEENGKLAALAAEARITEARLAHEQRALQIEAAAEVERVNLTAQADEARHAAAVARARQEIEQHHLRAEVTLALLEIARAEVAIAEQEAKKQAIVQDLEIRRARALREIDNVVTPERIQLMVAEKLPELAAAFQQQMGEVHVTAVDGANPLGFVSAAVEGVLGLARSAGLSLPAARSAKGAPAGEP